MKEISTSTTLLGLMLVTIVGCGSNDNPIGEEMSEKPVEPPMQIISPILGDWHLQAITWLKDGVETQRQDFTSFSFTLTLDPDRIFEVVHRFPTESVTSSVFLELKDWEHIQEIIVTHRGKYYIDENQLRLNLIATSVKPKEAPEIDSDFENPIFWYDVGNPGGSLDYSIADQGKELELRREEGEYMVKFIHRRPKNE